MGRRWYSVACLFVVTCYSPISAEELETKSRLQLLPRQELATILPSDTHLLLDPSSIEQFLDELDGNPPDWRTLYGHGHHDPGHDERLFSLNRERDAKRAGKLALAWLITFAWSGALSTYNAEVAGFPVAIGPTFTPTRWGIVRFKPEEAPGNLVVVADGPQLTALQQEISEKGTLDIHVLMTGRLIPEESLVYDFSHEEEGQGLIMPFIRVEQVQFVRLSS